MLIKKTGQPVTAKAEVADVKYFTLTPQKVEEIRIMYGKQIGTDTFEDWQSTLQKKVLYACLVKKFGAYSANGCSKKQWCRLDCLQINVCKLYYVSDTCKTAYKLKIE